MIKYLAWFANIICNLIVQSVDTSGSLGCTLGNSRDTRRPKLHCLALKRDFNQVNKRSPLELYDYILDIYSNFDTILKKT